MSADREARERAKTAEAELVEIKAQFGDLLEEHKGKLERVKAERDDLARQLDRVDDALAWKGTGEGRVSMALRGKVAEARLDKALSALRAVEWVNHGDHFSCPGCGNWKQHGHHPDCPLRAIAEIEGEAS